MAPSDHVLVQLSIRNLGVQLQGFGVPLVLSHTSTFPERIRTYTDPSTAATDHGADDPTALAVAQAFAQSPRPTRVLVGRMLGTVNQRYDVAALGPITIGKPFALGVVGEGIAATTVSYTPVADLSFAAANVDTVADSIAITHGMTTGHGPFYVAVSGGTLPAPLAAGTKYWAIVVDSGHLKLATSRANALAGTAVDITSAGGGGFSIVRSTNNATIANMVQQLGDALGSAFAVTQVAGGGADNDTLRATAAASGNWCSLYVSDRTALSLTQSHAAPSDTLIATDLAALLSIDSSWYAVSTHYNSAAYITAVAAWCEANKRMYAPVAYDTACATAAASGATDVCATVSALGYKYTLGPSFHERPSEMLGASALGRWLPTKPGASNLAYKALSGVTPSRLSATEQANLDAKRASYYYAPFTGLPFFWPGKVGSTAYNFAYVTRNTDALIDDIQKSLVGVLAGNEIVHYTDTDTVMLEGALRGAAERAQRNGILAAGWSVTRSSVDDASPTDRANGNYSGLRLQGRMAGAVQSVIPVDVVLSF